MIPPISSATETGAAPERSQVDPKLEKATLGFERVLLTQLLAPLAEAAGEDAPPAYKDMLPQALADAVVDGGGIGLAADLQRALKEQSR